MVITKFIIVFLVSNGIRKFSLTLVTITLDRDEH